MLRNRAHRVDTKIRYNMSFKIKMRKAIVKSDHVANVGVDIQTGYLYLAVMSDEDALYYRLIGDEAIRKELGI